MNRKKVLITGSTDGIGKQTAIELAKKDYNVIIHGRDESKTISVLKEIKEKTGSNNISYFISDFESLKSVEKIIGKIYNKLNNLDILINNAGVFKRKSEITKDGFEKTFQINYLAHFYLTNMLLDLILQSKNSKIINVASVSHKTSLDFSNLQGEKHYTGHDAHGRSKLCNILFTMKLDREINQQGFIINTLDPGNINTKLLKKGWGAIGDDISSGADNVIEVMKIENKSGNYYIRGRLSEPSKIANDEKTQDKLWSKSIKMIEKCNIDFNL